MLAALAGRVPVMAQSPATQPADEAAPAQTGDTTNGGPLLVPGDVVVSTDSSGDDLGNNDNTGTVVALVISGLLVVALLLALLTYWFWRNTRPAPPRAATPRVEG